MVPCSSCGSATGDQDRFCPTCGAALSPPERVGAGGLDDTVGSYRLVGVIGSGASGRVWLAYGHEGVPVAIKALSPSLVESAGFLDRFRSEAQIMAEMNHPHVVRLHEYLESSEGAWVVMEYVEGSSLRAVEDHAHLLGPEQALGVLSGALSGLGYAHGLGLVHGDLKPENILVDTGGDSKLADFGQVVSSGSAEPTLGGTPAYMSPESARGRPLDPRSDLYSAGVVLYEALAGRPPFRATNDLALLRMQVHEEPPPIEHLPPSVDLLLRRSLAKDPDLRPQSADEFIAELDEAARSGYGADWVARASVTALVAATTVVVASLAGSGPAISTGATVGGTQLGATTTGTAGATPLSAAPTQASLATAPVRKGLFQKLGATKLGGLIGAHPVASVALAGVLVAGAAAGGVVVATKGTAPSTETPTTTSTVGSRKQERGPSVPFLLGSACSQASLVRPKTHCYAVGGLSTRIDWFTSSPAPTAVLRGNPRRSQRAHCSHSGVVPIRDDVHCGRWWVRSVRRGVATALVTHNGGHAVDRRCHSQWRRTSSDVSCPSINLCLAVGSANVQTGAYSDDPADRRSWRYMDACHATARLRTAGAVSCPAVSFCMIGGNGAGPLGHFVLR